MDSPEFLSLSKQQLTDALDNTITHNRNLKFLWMYVGIGSSFYLGIKYYFIKRNQKK